MRLMGLQRRLRSEFRTMEIKQHSYTAIFDEFTSKSYIMIVSTNPGLRESASPTGSGIGLICN